MPNAGLGEAGAPGGPEQGPFPPGHFPQSLLPRYGWDPSSEHHKEEDLNNLMEKLMMENLYGSPNSAMKCKAQEIADSDEELCYYYDNDGDYYEDDDEEKWDVSSKECDAKTDEDSVPGTFCGFRKSFLCKDTSPAPPPQSSLDYQLLDLKLPQRQRVTAEEAEKNAKELVAEEERVKRKAEKKRLKKKRQKDRKRQEKLEQKLKPKPEMKSNEPCLNDDAEEEGAVMSLRKGPLDSSPSQRDPSKASAPRRGEGVRVQVRSEHMSTEEEMEDELDLSSTFVCKAQRKVGVKPLTPRKEKAPRAEHKEPDRKPQQEVPRPGQDVSAVDPSTVLAGYGNEAAARGYFQEAVLFFTEAVKLNPREHRLFGNRSYCYERMQQYDKALSDAHVALSLLPGWPKGFFRKGKALLGLKRYAEAKSTFLELLRLDSSHADAAAQLEICQVQLTLENGFNSFIGERSLPMEPSLGAMESQLAGSGEQARSWSPGSSGCGEGDEDGESGFVTITNSRSRGKGPGQQELRASGREIPASTRHPVATAHQAREWYAVWVGNVTPRITQKLLRRCFEEFGPIHSVRMLPEKYCAFINYTKKEAAEAAYAALQGAEVEGTKFVLQLKHPDHATPAPGRAGPGSALWPVGRCFLQLLESRWWPFSAPSGAPSFENVDTRPDAGFWCLSPQCWTRGKSPPCCCSSPLCKSARGSLFGAACLQRPQDLSLSLLSRSQPLLGPYGVPALLLSG
ncbi:tetratricopeptide repeat protein 31 isoform X3 [Gopherus evgoodei]|uniref:tetratricopeptide repeat protein 31 isoform X3 n=1 Tax=Gopherus evgoodei TaxID=1825980 RepID=UPI0011D0075C|nr:tetratricopeptide repeat protein 31 isoform X3 [Gopherus evgoodei]